MVLVHSSLLDLVGAYWGGYFFQGTPDDTLSEISKMYVCSACSASAMVAADGISREKNDVKFQPNLTWYLGLEYFGGLWLN